MCKLASESTLARVRRSRLYGVPVAALGHISVGRAFRCPAPEGAAGGSRLPRAGRPVVQWCTTNTAGPSLCATAISRNWGRTPPLRRTRRGAASPPDTFCDENEVTRSQRSGRDLVAVIRAHNAWSAITRVQQESPPGDEREVAGVLGWVLPDHGSEWLTGLLRGAFTPTSVNRRPAMWVPKAHDPHRERITALSPVLGRDDHALCLLIMTGDAHLY